MDPDDSERRRIEQARRAAREAEEAAGAERSEEVRAHRRRSEKARYLRDRLAEQAEHPDDDEEAD
jgi:hypothetical protein